MSHDESRGRVGCNLTIASAKTIGCRGGESTRLPSPMWPGFKSQRRRLFLFRNRSMLPLVTKPLVIDK